VREQRYFQCAQNCGVFMKATNKSITKISPDRPNQRTSSSATSTLAEESRTSPERRSIAPAATVRTREPAIKLSLEEGELATAESPVRNAAEKKSSTQSAVSSPIKQSRSSSVDDIKVRLEK